MADINFFYINNTDTDTKILTCQKFSNLAREGRKFKVFDDVDQ